jgi:hypothetical protein
MEQNLTEDEIKELINKRKTYRLLKNFEDADKIMNLLKNAGIIISDDKENTTYTLIYSNKTMSSIKDIEKIEKKEENKSKGRHSKIKNAKRRLTKHRGKMFVEWILQKFDFSSLNKIENQNHTRIIHILDVAGGKGDVSYYLSSEGVMCTVVDPANLKLSANKTKKLLKDFNYFSNGIESTTTNDKDDVFNFEKLWEEEKIRDIRLNWLDEMVIKSFYDFYKTDCKDLTNLKNLFNQMIFTIKNKLDYLNLHHEKEFFSSDENSRNLVKQSSLVLGFHPDQATEYIVDLALAMDVPFAVVPCCVFPTVFNKRFNKQGILVRTFEQFLDYLQDKSSKIQREVIPSIVGPNNICIYSI